VVVSVQDWVLFDFLMQVNICTRFQFCQDCRLSCRRSYLRLSVQTIKEGNTVK